MKGVIILSDNVIRPFVKKIVGHDNSIDWYLRFGNDSDTPKNVNVNGKKGRAVVVEKDKTTPTLVCKPTYFCNYPHTSYT